MKEGTVKLRAKRNFGNKTTAFVDTSQSQLDDVEVIREALDNLDCDGDSESDDVHAENILCTGSWEKAQTTGGTVYNRHPRLQANG